MPEREFELYLSVLSRMLRLNEQQKNAISDELRDHMEERFEELVRSGMNRDDAIRQALDEFGDAAGLAVDFTNVSKKRIRRIIMRSTAVIASLVAVCVFFLNDVDLRRPGLPGPGQIVAENSSTPGNNSPVEPAQDSNADVAKPIVTGDRPIDFVVAGEVVAPAFLQDATMGEFADTPLEDVADFWSTLHNVSILLDRAGLDGDGIATDTPTTISVDPFLPVKQGDKTKETDASGKQDPIQKNHISLAQALDWVTRMHEAEWYVDEGIIHITSRMAEEEREISRSYFIRQFLVDGFTENSLIETIQKMTSGHWMNIDGNGGTLALVGDVLTIRQNWQTHREIELLLAAILRHEKELPICYPESALRLASRIEQRIEDIDFSDTPLSDVVAYLSEAAEVRIRIDENALKEEGWDLDSPVSLKIQHQSLRTILRLALKPFDLQAIVHEGCLEITIASKANETLTTVAYDVRNLDDKAGQLRQLEVAIQSTNGGPWLDRDGVGGVLLMPGGGRMLVRQTDEGHREIRQLLAAQRRANSLGKTFESAGTELTRSTEVIRSARRGPLEKRFYRVPSETADDLLTVLPASIEPETWIQAAAFEQSTNTGRSVGTIAKVEVGQKVVKISNPSDDGGNATKSRNTGSTTKSASSNTELLVMPQAVLIIDQTPTIHEKIEKFLQKLDMDVKGVSLEDAQKHNSGGGLGGGGFF
tara:strand:- start:81065 stop:83176 length:2112 start_codon:yes stop_codon:yes gene_type:complete